MKSQYKEATNDQPLKAHFEAFRRNIIGIDAQFEGPYGTKRIVYADWIASGRLYRPIEERIANHFGPMVGNTHSESTETGTCMTLAYHRAHEIIKKHVHANEEDVIVTCGSGMTGVLAKFQRILGLRISEQLKSHFSIPDHDRPVVFITHMEHHSNQTPWLESIAEVVIVPPDDNLMVSCENLKKEIEKYSDRKVKIGSFSACSNVTGISTPYHDLAEIMHEHGGYCFVDFAASAPYQEIDMHPENTKQSLDAIFFSPHKFLGGPGSSGVLVFNKKLYKNRIPDHPGGGTVTWTNPWGSHQYVEDIEIREDGGTPGFLQAIRTALALRLKEKMGVDKMHEREMQLVERAFDNLNKIPGLNILADRARERLGIFSFYVTDIHHNLIVKLLNDKFGIQLRGGCSCAGTYGHYLLGVNETISNKITQAIDQGDLSMKPGWVRLSLHPTMTDQELDFIVSAISEVVAKIDDWKQDYQLVEGSNEYIHRASLPKTSGDFDSWFEL